MIHIFSMLLAFIFSCFCSSNLYAQNDTIFIDSKSLNIQDIKTGKSNYIIFTKKENNSYIRDLTFVEILVEKSNFSNIPVIKLSQNWYQNDTLTHEAISLLSNIDLKTLYHKSWWKKNNATTEVNFLEKKYELSNVDKSAINKIELAIEDSFKDTNFVNWHCDLHLFSLLPFNKAKVFKIKVYDPGYSSPRFEVYEHIGSEKMEGMDCWILNYKLPNNMGYQRFWISKSDKIVIKEEDNFRGNFRYKYKLTSM